MPSRAGRDWAAKRGVPASEGVAEEARWEGLDLRLGTNLVVDLSARRRGGGQRGWMGEGGCEGKEWGTD